MLDRDQSILWAREVLALPPSDVVIFDTETTGLGWGSEIIQIGAIDGAGQVLINRMVKPLHPIPEQATMINHITDWLVESCPTWPEVWPEVAGLLVNKYVVSYNLEFDVKMLQSSNAKNKLAPPFPLTRSACAMLNYSAFYGDWDSYHHGWRYQKLIGGDHSALGDCRATLERIQHMAAARLATEKQGVSLLRHEVTDANPEQSYGTSPSA